MSTIIRVGKTRTVSLKAITSSGQVVDPPHGTNISWGDWQDGGNISLGAHPTSADIHCYGNKTQSDFVKGRPAVVRADVTIPGYVAPVTLTEEVYLADDDIVGYKLVWSDES